jgi:hypothetical protein
MLDYIGFTNITIHEISIQTKQQDPNSFHASHLKPTLPFPSHLPHPTEPNHPQKIG